MLRRRPSQTSSAAGDSLTCGVTTPAFRSARADADFIAAVAAPLATGLRHCQAGTFIDPATPHRPDLGPVVLTLDDDLRITSRTAASRAWLDALLPPEPDQKAIPASVYNVAAQLLAVENGVDAHPAFARTHLADGFWLALRAARLSSDQPVANRAATIVVTIEEASASDRLELFGRAFGLSVREYRAAWPPCHRQRHPDDGTADGTVRAHHPGPSQVDLCQDRRARPRHRPVARPRHPTLTPPDEPGRPCMTLAMPCCNHGCTSMPHRLACRG